jgi:hypothetical protein
MIITTTILPPAVKYFINPCLLDPILGMKMHVQNKIKPISKKKIRDCDIGKKKEFEKLLTEFEKEYERQKVKKKEYEEKIKNAEKRPSLPITGGTMHFTRFLPQK